MSTPKKKTATVAPQMELADAPKGGETLQANVQLPVLIDTHPIVAQIQQFIITDQASFVALAEKCQDLGARWEAIEKQRVDMKAPALEMSRKVDSFFQPALKALEQARKVGREKLEAWDAEQRHIAAEKQRVADELARKEREAKEAQARRERERTAKALEAVNDLNTLAAGAGRAMSVEKIEQLLEVAQNFKITPEDFGDHIANVQTAHATTLASIQQTLLRFKELAEQRAQAKSAEETAAAERATALAARQAQLKAEREQKRAEEEARQLREASEKRAAELEQQAATTVAPTVTAELTQVEGMNRAKTYTWKLIDKSKVKSDFLVLDTKAIDALVRSAKERAAEIVGGIEVELTYTNRMK